MAIGFHTLVAHLLIWPVVIIGASGCAGGTEESSGRAQSVSAGEQSVAQVPLLTDQKQKAAYELVERYWSSEPADRFALLAEDYKRSLRESGITSAMQYADATQAPERVWGTRTYQRILLEQRAGREVGLVELSIEWEQEGYRGVMTHIFEFVDENGDWKITHIMH